MSSSAETLKISDDTRVYIIDELIEPYYKKVVKNTIEGRQCWRKTGIAFETISKIMVAFGSILSFSAGVYQDQTLSFVSGSISCLSLAFLQFSSFSYKENKKQSEELNVLLKTLGLETIPVLERTAAQGKQVGRPQSNQPPPQPPPQPPQLPFTLPFDLSMLQQDKSKKDNEPSTLSTFNSMLDSCKDTITSVRSDIKDEVLDDIDPVSNLNVNINISSESSET